MSVRILQGDVLARLAGMADRSVHCVVTSPPYWRLRDYGIAPSDWAAVRFAPISGLAPIKIPAMTCCLGLEPEPWAFVGHLVLVFREVRRVLREDGTCWMNLGDSYAGGHSTYEGKDAKWQHGGEVQTRKSVKGAALGLKKSSFRRDRRAREDDPHKIIRGLKAKDLVGMPWRCALALQADGWYLRSDVIWHKPNPMPEGVTDRPTKSHEYVFLMSRSERYFYDAEAIKEDASPDSHARYSRGRSESHKWADGGPGDQSIAKSYEGMLAKGKAKIPSGWETSVGNGAHGSFRREGRAPGVTPKSAKAGSGIKANESFRAAVGDLVSARNKRTVWTITTKGYSEAHFATFPPELPEICIRASTSEKGVCAACGTPWRRMIEKGAADLEHQRACGGDRNGDYHGTATKDFASARAQDASATKARILAGMKKRETAGWAAGCGCGAGIAPATVLDPFAGAGTTLLVADRLGRDAVGIELNPEYAEMAARRIHGDSPLFADVGVE